MEAGIAAFEKAKGRAPSAAEIGVITRQTRNEKMTEISTPAVRAAQAAQLTAAERKELQALTVAARQRGPVLGQNGADGQGESTREQTALGAAVAHRFERASVLKGHEVLAEALNADLGKLDLQKLKGEVRAGSAGLVALEKDGTSNDALSARFATGRGIALEKWSVGFVNQTKGACPALLPGRVAVAEWLSDEQKEAVRFVGASRDQVTAIRGVAGAGKTTLLKELDSYRQFTHGYVVTSHKSQRRTADKVVVAAARLDSKAAYVACSRGRQSCAVFTPEKASLFAGLPRSADRQAALDVLREQEGDRKLRAVQKPQLARAGALERTVAAAPMPAPERQRVAVQTRTRGHDLGLSR